MEILLLKSAACLAILMVFYKLFLEKLSIHKFKRFYLLGALLVSAIIPFITFIKYVEPTFDVPYFDIDHSTTLELLSVNEPEVIEPVNYLPIILWSIYGIGVLLFAVKFSINLIEIVSKINKNEKQKHSNFISVLLNDLIVPHTFFSYIFLNKTKFKAKAIPEEVLLHEQTHAKQKHSLDILFIELLHVVFWFNPLLYYIKKDIKLNHEFLADEAVLKQGIDSSTYQKILLQFTSNTNEILPIGVGMAHAINYSLIKKRFTIMKTQTSKKAIWFRSLLLCPLLGLLLFSFSSTKEVEKDVLPAMVFPEEIQNNSNSTLTDLKAELQKANALKINYTKNHTARSIIIDVFKNGTYEIDGIKATKKTFKQVINKLHQDITTEIRNNIINVHVNSPKDISDKEVLFIYNSFLDYGFHRIVTYNQEVVRAKGNKPFAIGENKNELTLKSALNNSINTVNKKYSSQIQKPILTVNGITCDGCKLNLSKKGVEHIILGTTTEDEILEFKIKFKGKSSVWLKSNRLNTNAIKNIKNASLGDVVQLFDIKTTSKLKLKSVAITLVDKNDKNYSHSPMVRKGDKSILPPPPPPPPTKAPQYEKDKKLTLNQIIKKTPKGTESGFEMLKNGESHYYTVNQGKKTYYNKDGYITDKNGKVLPPPPPAPKALKGQASNISNIPPPPPPPAPKSPIDQIVYMAKKGATFYYNTEKISSDKAIEIVKNNSKLNISSQNNNGKLTVHLSTKPISVVNGRATILEERKELIKKRQKALIERKENKVKALKERKEKQEIMLKKRKAIIGERKKTLQKRQVEKELIKEKRQLLYKQFYGMEANGGAFFYEGKKISEAEAISLIKENPDLNVTMHVNNGKKTVHISKKGNTTYKGKLVRQQKPADMAAISRSDFNLKLNDSSTVKLLGAPNNIFSSKTINKKQLAYRKAILRATEMKKEKFNYTIEEQQASINAVKNFIKKHPESSIKTINNSNGILTLAFSKSDEKKMSYNEMQSIYSKVFNQ